MINALVHLLSKCTEHSHLSCPAEGMLGKCAEERERERAGKHVNVGPVIVVGFFSVPLISEIKPYFLFDLHYFGVQLRAGLEGLVRWIRPVSHELVINGLGYIISACLYSSH